jgi:hypothetical protein
MSTLNRGWLMALVLAIAPAAHAGRPAPIGIVASVGTTSARPDVAEQMIRGGTVMFRFNLAHKDKRLALREAGVVRDAAHRLGAKVSSRSPA